MRFDINIKNRKTYIDVVKTVCCIWITLIWHMNEYLLVPRQVENTIGLVFTDTVLAVFFFFSGALAVKRGILADAFETKDIGSWLLNKFLRIYPLFAVSLTSIFIATKFFKVYEITFSQYILSLVGLGWIAPSQIATFWFVSQLITYIIITAFIIRIRSIKIRGILIVSVYLALLLLLLCGIDERMILFYPAYFGGFVLSKCIFEIDLKRNVHLIGIISIAACMVLLFFARRCADYETINIPLKVASFTVVGTGIIYVCLLISKFQFMTIVYKLIGYASYCMYLFHRQVYEGTRIIIGKDFSRVFSYVVFWGMCMLSIIIQYCYSFIIVPRKDKKR